LVRSKTILLVEDNQLNLTLLTDLLEYEGYTVVATRFGEAAVQLAGECQPELILMDVQLPDISGTEATRRLKADERTRGIPVLAVTAFTLSEEEQSVPDGSFDGYVAKPIKIHAFLDTITSYLGTTK
jgi:two-component system, cell cycle response regulator DivK